MLPILIYSQREKKKRERNIRREGEMEYVEKRKRLVIEPLVGVTAATIEIAIAIATASPGTQRRYIYSMNAIAANPAPITPAPESFAAGAAAPVKVASAGGCETVVVAVVDSSPDPPVCEGTGLMVEALVTMTELLGLGV
jgi:hypothetical protein